MQAIAAFARTEVVSMNADPEAPEISILVSSYNHASFVADAVRSCLEQSGVALEVLVIDDGSTDDSVAQLRSIQDPRLRVFTQENRGLSRALNRVLAEARGSWVKFLPSDDRLLPDCLAKQLAAAHGSIASFCLPEVVDAFLRPLEDPAPQAWFDVPEARGAQVVTDLLDRNCLSAPCGLFSRAAAVEIGGFDASMRVAQDYDLWLRLASLGDLHRFPERLVQVRWHGANQSGEVSASSEQERARALVGSLRRDGLPLWCKRMESQTGSRSQALEALVAALLDSGLAELHGFVEELAAEIRQAGGGLDFDPRLAAIVVASPELPATAGAGGRPERESS